MRYASFEEIESALKQAEKSSDPVLEMNVEAIRDRWDKARERACAALTEYSGLLEYVFYGIVCRDAEIRVGFGGLLVNVELVKEDIEPHQILEDTIDPEGEWDIQ